MRDRHMKELWMVDVRNPRFKERLDTSLHSKAHTGPKPWEED